MNISLSHESINIMLQSQKTILKEFGVRIALNDDQFMVRVLEYASQSDSEDLKECTNKLKQFLLPGKLDIASTPSEHKQATIKRMYRGQPPPEEVADAPDKNHNTEDESKSNLIYRGQPVL